MSSRVKDLEIRLGYLAKENTNLRQRLAFLTAENRTMRSQFHSLTNIFALNGVRSLNIINAAQQGTQRQFLYGYAQVGNLPKSSRIKTNWTLFLTTSLYVVLLLLTLYHLYTTISDLRRHFEAHDS